MKKAPSARCSHDFWLPVTPMGKRSVEKAVFPRSKPAAKKPLNKKPRPDLNPIAKPKKEKKIQNIYLRKNRKLFSSY